MQIGLVSGFFKAISPAKIQERSIYCVVSLIGGTHKDQVQRSTLISTSAKVEKTIIKNFNSYSIKYLPFKASNILIVGENPHQSCGGGREKVSFFSGFAIR